MKYQRKLIVALSFSLLSTLVVASPDKTSVKQSGVSGAVNVTPPEPINETSQGVSPNITNVSAAGFIGSPKIAAPESLDDLLNMNEADKPDYDSAEDIQRALIVRAAAFELGLARGFAQKFNAEMERIKQAEDLLNQQFSFRDLFLMANHERPAEEALHWQPPVVTRLEDVVQIENEGRLLRTVDGVFRIISKERFVSQPPRWQEYIFTGVVTSNPTVAVVALPKNSRERDIWKAAIASGWQQGLYQATEEMQHRIRRLGRDYNGMLQYVMLKLTNQVNLGFVAYDRRGVVGGGDEMSVNARTYQITNDVKLNPSSEKWRGYGSTRLPPSYEAAGLRVFRDVQRCAREDSAECQ